METQILQWNANSLNAHSAELKNFIKNSRNPPDIVCVQETFFKPNTTFKIAGYSSEIKCRQNEKGGGVATFIRDGIVYSRQNAPENAECVVITITANKQQIQIHNLYLSPTCNPDFKYLQQILENPQAIICGDLNAKNTLWGAPENDARGKILGDLIDENNITVLNTGAGTHIKQDGTLSHLDISLATNNIAAKCNWRVHDEDWGSDHLPSFTVINEKPDTEETQSNKFVFKKADWERFNNEAKTEIVPSLQKLSIDEHAAHKCERIIQKAKKTIPKCKANTKRRRLVPYWNDACTEAVKNKERTRKQMHKTKTLEDQLIYRQAKAKAQFTLKKTEKEHWQNYCSTINSSTKLSSVWQMTKKCQECAALKECRQ
jgi:exonuclease III